MNCARKGWCEMRAREPNTGRFAKASSPKKNGKGNGHARDAAWTFDAAKVAQARASKRGEQPFINPYRVAEPPPGVLPPGKRLAMDSFPGLAWGADWAGMQQSLFAAYDANVNFVGYPTLAVLAQLPEYRNLSETIATEMTRKWIRFHKRSDSDDKAEQQEGKEEGEGEEPEAEGSRREDENENDQAADKGPLDDLKTVMALSLAHQVDEFANENEELVQAENAEEEGEADPDDPDRETDTSGEEDDKIRELEDAFDRLGVRDLFTQMAINDGFFGRAHLFLDFGDDFVSPEGKQELVSDIGPGRGDISKIKCSPEHPLKRIVSVEPTWAYPANYDASNPLALDWYNPITWYVQQNEIHRSRFLTFVGRAVPDLLKPAFAFGGLSLTQMAKPTVDNWLRTRRGVGDIINSFSIFVLATNLNQNMTGGSNFLLQRALEFNATRDNQGLLLIDKNQEEFTNIAAPLSTLDVLQAQSQEHMCSVSRIPIVKLLGVQPAGLNADSEGVIRTFYDSINAFQHRFFRTHLQTIFWFVQLSLWGEVDEDITFDFEPLWELDELQKAQKRKSDADTDNVLIQAGVIDPEEARQRVANDPDQPYQEIDANDVPEPPEPEMPPGFGGGGGGFGGPPKPPGAGPAGAPKPKVAAAKPSNTKGGSPARGDSTFRGGLDAAEWKEADHPRRSDGKFGSGGGGTFSAASAYKEHAAVNDWLRGDRSAAAGSKAENEKIVKEMDDLIASNKLAEPKTLYRGFGDFDAVAAVSKRGTLRDKAFFSTSTDPEVARGLGGEKYIAQIDAPAGTPAYEYEADDPQKEVVLPRGSKFKVVGVDHEKKIIKLRVCIWRD